MDAVTPKSMLPRPAEANVPPMILRARAAVAELKKTPGEVSLVTACAALGDIARYLDADALADVIGYAGRKIMPDVINVDLNTNIAERNSVRLKLRENPAAALYCLCKAYPNYASARDLRLAIWGKSEADNPQLSDNTLRVLISQMRNQLVPLGASITSKHGVGYRLDLGPMEGQ